MVLIKLINLLLEILPLALQLYLLGRNLPFFPINLLLLILGVFEGSVLLLVFLELPEFLPELR